jgi:hypothetical protein
MRSMARSADTTTRTTRDAANASAFAVIVYAVLWLVSTQVASFRAVSPFADDPWDAFASFAAIFLPVVAGATWVRSLRHRGRLLPPITASRIRWGSGLAAGIVLVTAGADVQAIMTVGFGPEPGFAESVLLGLVTASVILATIAVALSLRAAWVAGTGSAVAVDPQEPDVVDDFLALASDAGRRLGVAEPVDKAAFSVERFLDRSRLSPRRHRLLFGVVLALLAGLAFDAWHAIREGPWASAAPALVFGALIAVGVLAIYLGTVVPLRLLRPPIPRSTSG